MSELFLNVSAALPSSHANGPGRRAVIWVQGCTLACPGCYNSSTHSHLPNHLVPVEELSSWVSSIEDIEGITFSGGEPFEQSKAVSEVIRLSRESQPQLSVFVFTGFTLEELSSSPNDGVTSLLNSTDMLSSGRYEYQNRDPDLLWRGSSNQTLEYLTDRYSRDMEEKWLEESPVEEVIIRSDDSFRTGFLGARGPLHRIIKEVRR